MSADNMTERMRILILNEDLGPGYHTRVLDAGDLASGIYFSRMTAGDFTGNHKLVLLE